jgi:hypothetical protein
MRSIIQFNLTFRGRTRSIPPRASAQRSQPRAAHSRSCRIISVTQSLSISRATIPQLSGLKSLLPYLRISRFPYLFMRDGLKVLTGEDLVAIFARFGFVVVGGSKHVKLRRSSPVGDETLVIPNHDPIAKGTPRAIFLQASHYIPQQRKVRPFLGRTIFSPVRTLMRPTVSPLSFILATTSVVQAAFSATQSAPIFNSITPINSSLRRLKKKTATH